VPHHGLDLADPDERFSVADFRGHVESILPSIGTRCGVALLVGGTGFWLRAIADGLDLDALPWDPDIRAALEADLAGRDWASLPLAFRPPHRHSRQASTCETRAGSSVPWRSRPCRATCPAPRRAATGLRSCGSRST